MLGSLGGVKRKPLRIVLVTLLVISAAFAAWAWLRPYQWGADGGARCRVVGCQVRRDVSNHWLDIHLKVIPGQKHDLELPVRLLTAEGRSIEPAQTTLSDDQQKVIRELWFKFWMEKDDFSGPLDLSINGGRLSIRTGRGEPQLGMADGRYFITNHW